MISHSRVEDFAGPLGDADLATALELLVADAGRLVALGIDMGEVRNVDRAFLFDDAAGQAHRRLPVPLHHVDALADDPVFLGPDAPPVPGLASGLARADDDLVALLDLPP